MTGRIKQSKRIVLKIGSALMVDSITGMARQDWLETLAQDITTLQGQGKEIVIVSSGAIALGRKALSIPADQRSSSIPLNLKQAAAAVGNVALIRAYETAFAPFDRRTALILLSPKDTEERKTHLNARATIHTLLAQSIIPVINENDTVSTQEIRFGDNDRLAARVAQMIEADLLIQLSTTDGLYTDDPSMNPDASHISLVDQIDERILSLAGDTPKGVSTGGMKSKIIAAQMAIQAGIPMMIANGRNPNPLEKLLTGENRFTLFETSNASFVPARKKWIAGAIKPLGDIIIDVGAVKALQQGKSLLPSGVTAIEGAFDYGDPVQVIDQNGKKIATALINYSAEESRRLIGVQSADIDEILGYSRSPNLIHRDNLVLTV